MWHRRCFRGANPVWVLSPLDRMWALSPSNTLNFPIPRSEWGNLISCWKHIISIPVEVLQALRKCVNQQVQKMTYIDWLENNASGFLWVKRRELQNETPHCGMTCDIPLHIPAGLTTQARAVGPLVWKMVGVSIEQRVNVKFLVKLVNWKLRTILSCNKCMGINEYEFLSGINIVVVVTCWRTSRNGDTHGILL